MFRERHCTGVVYNETAMLSQTFHQFENQFESVIEMLD